MILKTQCEHCEGPIEFEAEDADPGQLVECPHCAQDTGLPGTVFRTAPRRGYRRLIRIALFTVAVAAGLYGLVRLIGLGIEAVVTAPDEVAQASRTAIYLVIGLVLLLLSLLWILFPVFVYFGLQRLETLLNKIERNTRP